MDGHGGGFSGGDKLRESAQGLSRHAELKTRNEGMHAVN